MNDTALRHAVEQELEWSPHVDAADVTVSVNDGIVRLTGGVASLVEKTRAERSVYHVRGVRGVMNDIEVRRPGAHAHSDAELTRRAAAVLGWDARLPPGAIQVAVTDGIVRLTGEVEWQYQRLAAEERIRELAGVVGVDNRITLRPSAEAQANLREKIRLAFERHAELDASEIGVDVDGDTVRLTGRVGNHRERRIAENAAWSAQGVSTVINLLSVRH